MCLKQEFYYSMEDVHCKEAGLSSVANLQTGASLGIVGRIAWQLTSSTTLRASAKFGTMGMEFEVGGSQQITEFSSAGCSIATGLQVTPYPLGFCPS